MTRSANPLPVIDQSAAAARLVVNPFLHLGPDRLYNPLADRFLDDTQPGGAELRRVLAGELLASALPAGLREELRSALWLVPAETDGSRAFRLKYVSLEAHTVCNQSCYFCPVHYAPRAAYFMPTELYERIVSELAAYRDTIEGVFMINYNEPTVDRRFVEQVANIKRHGLPPAALTNASGLTPERVDALVALGGLRYLSVNCSTLDPDKYQRDRGIDQVDLIVRNLDYMADRAVAEEMEIVVLGGEDDQHRVAHAAIAERYGGSRFRVESRRLMDRAGYLDVGDTVDLRGKRLCGCENTGSRPLQHLHITPRGKVVLCCEDYDENYVVGELEEESVDQVLTGERFTRLRRWVYGVDEAPADFICRRCVFALAR